MHKLVLLAMSPYLQETFKNADPRSQLEVNLPSDTTYETAKAFLKYIYEGILEVSLKMPSLEAGVSCLYCYRMKIVKVGWHKNVQVKK